MQRSSERKKVFIFHINSKAQTKFSFLFRYKKNKDAQTPIAFRSKEFPIQIGLINLREEHINL